MQPGDDPRTAFLQSLPRKLVELKATLGALIADPRSSRMRDELRRRLHALYTLTRSYGLGTLTDGLRASIDLLDGARSAPTLSPVDLERLAALLASMAQRSERDFSVPAPFEPLAPGEGPRPHTLVGIAVPPSPVRPSLFPPEVGSADQPVPLVSTKPAPRPARLLTPSPNPSSLPPPPAGPACVLYLGSSVGAMRVRGALTGTVELLQMEPGTPAAEVAARARDAAPDVIAAELADPAEAEPLLAAIRADPLTDFLPVVLLVPEALAVDAFRARVPDAADVLPATAAPAALAAALESAFLGASPTLQPSAELGEVTLDELTRTLQEELRRGILGAAAPGHRASRIALGPGNDVLAATWKAIARIREVVEKRSHGRVRFDLAAAPRGLPGTHVVALGEATPMLGEGEAPSDDPLPGRSVLVVDDDPGVVASFAALLRQAGMVVTERTEGAAALSASHELRPDLVIADILMPGLDGIALCRALRQDILLRHTPVILLSWREDLLIRTRELGAQAQGYLRKESRGDAVLAQIRAVLRPRARILRRLRELAPGAELCGRIERVSVLALLEESARSLVDATVTVSDAFSVTELEVRHAHLVSVLRTVQDGSLSRGEPALLQVLGALSARFAVRHATHAVRANVSGGLEALLQRATARVTSLERMVSGPALLDVLRVDIDRPIGRFFARSLPSPRRGLFERLLRGEAPRDLALRDGLAPVDIEAILVELARRGAIDRVIGPHGEELTAASPPLAPESLLPPPPGTVPAVRTTRELFAPRAPADEAAPAAPPVEAPTLVAAPSVADEAPAPQAPAVPDAAADAGLVASVPRPAPGDLPPSATASSSPGLGIESLADAVWRELRDSVADEGSPRLRPRAQPFVVPAPPPREESEPSPGPVSVPPPEIEVVPAPSTEPPPATPRVSDVPDALRATPTDPTNAVDDAPPTPASSPPQDAHEPPTTSGSPLAAASPKPERAAPLLPAPPEDLADAVDTGPPGATPALVPTPAQTGHASIIVDPTLAPGPRENRASRRPPAPHPRLSRPSQQVPPRTRPGLIVLGMIVAFVASFSAVRWLQERGPAVVPEVPGEDAAAPVTADADASASLLPDVAGALDAPRAAVSPDASSADVVAQDRGGGDAPANADEFGRPYLDPTPYLDGRTLEAGFGLLVVRGPRHCNARVEVQIDQRSVGSAPVRLPLAAGLYRVRFRAGIITSYQFASVRAGRALVIRAPSER